MMDDVSPTISQSAGDQLVSRTRQEHPPLVVHVIVYVPFLLMTVINLLHACPY